MTMNIYEIPYNKYNELTDEQKKERANRFIKLIELYNDGDGGDFTDFNDGQVSLYDYIDMYLFREDFLLMEYVDLCLFVEHGLMDGGDLLEMYPDDYLEDHPEHEEERYDRREPYD